MYAGERGNSMGVETGAHLSVWLQDEVLCPCSFRDLALKSWMGSSACAVCLEQCLGLTPSAF